MSDGSGCKCFARCQSDCVCDVDWTPRELVEARQQLAALREENERLKSSRQRLFDLVRHCRIELHDEGLITDEEYAILVDDPDSLSRLHGYDSLAEELARLRDERAVHVGEIENLYKENNQLQAELDAWKESQ